MPATWRCEVKIGDEVVIMSAPGRFKVIAVDGPVLTIESADGVRRVIYETGVRTVDKRASD